MLWGISRTPCSCWIPCKLQTFLCIWARIASALCHGTARRVRYWLAMRHLAFCFHLLSSALIVLRVDLLLRDTVQSSRLDKLAWSRWQSMVGILIPIRKMIFNPLVHCDWHHASLSHGTKRPVFVIIICCLSAIHFISLSPILSLLYDHHFHCHYHSWMVPNWLANRENLSQKLKFLRLNPIIFRSLFHRWISLNKPCSVSVLLRLL